MNTIPVPNITTRGPFVRNPNIPGAPRKVQRPHGYPTAPIPFNLHTYLHTLDAPKQCNELGEPIGDLF